MQYKYVIGSIVLDKGQIAQVTAINCTGDIETTVSKITNWELLEGIDLTDEILLKSGFYRSDDFTKIETFRFDLNPQLVVRKVRGSSGFYVTIGYLDVPIYCVSDLQAALYSTPYFNRITSSLLSTIKELIK